MRFVEHRHHLDVLFDGLGVHERVVLVGHDWGGVLAVDWARRHPGAVRGIADLETLVAPVSRWMASSPVPKLFVDGDPGALLTGPLRERCRRWPVQTEVTVPGLHFLPEDSAPEIAAALDGWLGALA